MATSHGHGSEVRPHGTEAALAAAVTAFWRSGHRFDRRARAAIDRLGRAALSRDGESAALGTRLLFERIVEPLCDDFSPAGAHVYRRAFARVISLARSEKVCRPVATALDEEGIRSEADLMPRLCPRRLDGPERARIRRAFVLSRLTLGADVAISSGVLCRARQRLPNASITLVGAGASRIVADSVDGVDLLEVEYGRFGALAARLNAWAELRRRLAAACEGLAAHEVVVLDTDSRLSQLGLLPPTRRFPCYRFRSRSYPCDDPSPLSLLVGRWLEDTLGGGPASMPHLELPADAIEWSASLRRRFGREAPIVCISTGVGQNERKCAGADFERALIEWLVREGCRVLLARGAGELEVARVYRLANRLGLRRIPVLHLPPGRSLASLDASRPPAVVTFEGDVATFAAAIHAADCYIGYDSAGQHIAAALGVPTLTVFIESAGPRHAARWRPRGPAPVQVVGTAPPPDPARLLASVRSAFGALRREWRTDQSRSPSSRPIVASRVS